VRVWRIRCAEGGAAALQARRATGRPPLLTDAQAAQVERALLERLTPPERAALVLREAFGHSHREVADILDLVAVHVRQIYRRAREHVSAARKRFDVTPEQRRELLERFLEATLDGDMEELEKLLADDVAAWSDGGGKAPALRRPVTGRADLLRYLALTVGHPQWTRMSTGTVDSVNGEPAILLHLNGKLFAVMVLEFDGDRVTALYAVNNPDKLAFFMKQTM
jgi:hypothetical protein